MRNTTLLAVVLLAGVATGCNSTSTGEPHAENTVTAPGKLPERPRETNVEGL